MVSSFRRHSIIRHKMMMGCLPKDLTIYSKLKHLVSPKYIAEQSKLLNMSAEHYLTENKFAFNAASGDAEQSKHFSYSLQNGYFIWKQKLRDNIEILFGKLELESLPYDTSVNEFIETTIYENNHLAESLIQLRKRIDLLEFDNQNLISQLKSSSNLKQEMEDTLHSAFLKLLNSKKSHSTELCDTKIPCNTEEITQLDDSSHLKTSTHFTEDLQQQLINIPKEKNEFSNTISAVDKLHCEININDTDDVFLSESLNKASNSINADCAMEEILVENKLVGNKRTMPDRAQGKKHFSATTATSNKSGQKQNTEMSGNESQILEDMYKSFFSN